MSTKGLYLYFGFKISEKKIIKYFYNSAFQKYIKDEFKKPEYNDHKINVTKKITREDFRTIRHMVKEYYDESFFYQCLYDNEENYKDDPLIHTYCIPCCLYSETPEWIIGIKVACLLTTNGIEKTKFHKITNDDITKLNTINEKFQFTTKKPRYYNIPIDCWYCT